MSYAMIELAIVFICVFVALYIALGEYKRKRWASFYIPEGMYEPSLLAFYARASALLVSFALLLITLMAPNRGVEITKAPKTKTVDEIVFILDTSASMRARDTSVLESRFDRAKEIISEIVEKLGGINVSLIAFSGNEDIQVAPTNDYLYFRQLLDALRINEPGITGTSFYALFDSLEKMVESSQFSKSTLFVLVSDGEDSALLDLTADEKAKAEKLLLDKVEAIVQYGSRFDIIAMGSSQGATVPELFENGASVTSKLNRSFLEAIANTGNGKIFEENRAPVLTIVDGIAKDTAITAENVPQGYAPVKEAVVPLMASFFFILAALFIPQTRQKR